MCTWALFHSFDTSDATVFTSQPTQGQNMHRQVTEFFNTWHTHQQKGPTSSLQVHSLCKYTSCRCIQVESVSEITPVMIRAVCHTANIHNTCRLGSDRSAKVNIQRSITTVSRSTHTCKTFVYFTSRCMVSSQLLWFSKLKSKCPLSTSGKLCSKYPRELKD